MPRRLRRTRALSVGTLSTRRLGIAPTLAGPLTLGSSLARAPLARAPLAGTPSARFSGAFAPRRV
ncbi:hypothetical protein [Gordonia sp. 852002-51296_SCH5728562-b]|uniref:hypothetical protein n=1 Tax=Gordonia sp. 852002-51296_SCH5728562-b TaxID=1834101 RepID=UPI0012E84601|nr:hypothetical protein [Gordonia sp. 852002-51296_SCH5728562-b]